MEYDADLRPLSQHWEIKIPSFYDPLTLTRREIGRSAKPNTFVIYTTASSEEARRNYLRMVSLMERKRYELEHGLLRSYMYE